MDTLFTMLAEFKGGTYIQQIHAPSASEALRAWKSEAVAEVASLSKTPFSCFSDSDIDPPVPLNGCSNVWCTTGIVDKNLLLMNIVATASVPVGGKKTNG